MAKEKTQKTEETKAEAGGAQQQAPGRLQIDETGIGVENCDYWLISGTPEEVIVRFGDTRASAAGEPIKITHKIILNYYTAKRLRDALSQTMVKYDEALGSMKV